MSKQPQGKGWGLTKGFNDRRNSKHPEGETEPSAPAPEWNLPSLISISAGGSVPIRQYAQNAAGLQLSVTGLATGLSYNSELEQIEADAEAAASSGSANFAIDPSGLNVTDQTTVATPGVSSFEKKWNPGIYTRIQGARSSFDMALHQSFADEIADMPNVKGMKIHLYWGQLEGSTPGDYTFNTIWTLYNYLKARGLRLAVHITTRQFSSTTALVVPQYLQPSSVGSEVTSSGSPAGASLNSSGSTGVALLWRDYVMDRYIALLQALGDAFDDESHFEAVMTTETAVSAPYPSWCAYSLTSHIDQLERMCQAAPILLPKTNLVVFFNFLSSSSGAVRLYEAIYNNKCAFGGPDINPQGVSEAEGDTRPYPLGVQTRVGDFGGFDYRTSGGLYNHPALMDIQPPQMGGVHGNWTPEELMNEAWNGIACSHVFVSKKTYEASPVTSEPDCANWGPVSGSFAACQIGFKQYINSGAANPPALNQQYPLSYG